jgi:hypothetical protein
MPCYQIRVTKMNDIKLVLDKMTDQVTGLINLLTDLQDSIDGLLDTLDEIGEVDWEEEDDLT